MYVGSNAFQLANQKAIQKQRIRGTIDTIAFSAANVLAGSMTITNQISDQSDAKIGSVYIGKLTCTFLKNTQINPRTWRNRKITVEFGLCTSENPDVYEYFKLGEYYVSEAQQSADGVTITAYDAMSFFDQRLPDSYLASGTIYSITNNICNICGVELGMNETQMEALPNGTETLGLYTPNDCTTYRDLIYWISVTVGGWATINRDGKLIFGTYLRQNTSVDTIDEYDRVLGASFSDFVTDFGSAAFDNPDGSQEIIGSTGIGVQYQVGFNPLLQFGTPETKTRLRGKVYNSIRNIVFMPYKIERISAPVYDLGDIVSLIGGIASDIEHIAVVHSMTWTAGKGLTIQGFGADPRLNTVLSAKSSSSSSQNKSVKASEMVMKRFENLSAITVGSEPVQVVKIDFTANRETEVEIWHEIQMLTHLDAGSSSMTIEAVYYMDQVEMTRHPIETYSDSAYHLLDLHYDRHILDGGTHTWEVFLEASGGTASMRINDILAVLKGQGLEKADGWSGIIILDDIFDRNAMEIHVRDYTDSVQVTIHDNLTAPVSDTYQRTKMECNSRSYTEEYNIIFYQPEFGINTEDDIPLVDEADAFIITE